MKCTARVFMAFLLICCLIILFAYPRAFSLDDLSYLHSGLFNLPNSLPNRTKLQQSFLTNHGDQAIFSSVPAASLSTDPSPRNQHSLGLAVVCCENRFNETKTMIKSALGLSHSHVTVIVFTEEHLMQSFVKMYSEWPRSVQSHVHLDLRKITFPPGQDAVPWRKLFRPCASQRLFLPSLLKEYDALIYVDTDVLFLTPLETLWHFFSQMNSSHMAALTPEHEDLATGWYNRFAKHPYYGRLGVNSGVMLMNLTRMRKFGWEDYVVPIYQEYKNKISWGDQDIINIIFHYHPETLYIMGCEYNFRSDHCMYTSVCKTIEKAGVLVVHGSRKVLHTEKQPAFHAIYQAWEQFQLGEDLRQDLYYPMQRYLLKTQKTNCGKLYNRFLEPLKVHISL